MTHNSNHLLSFKYLENTTRPLGGQSQTVLFSGGQDSSVVLWFLYHTAHKTSHQLCTLHYNHIWQRDNFFMADHTAKISFWLNCPQCTATTTYEVDSEQQASQWRTSMNRRLMSHKPSSILVNGHTQSDQQESTLFAIIREITGEGHGTTKQYASIQANDTIISTREGALDTVLRPLGALGRQETGFVARIHHLPVYPDISNMACETTRAQIRYIILPLLTKLGFGAPEHIELPGTRTQN